MKRSRQPARQNAGSEPKDSQRENREIPTASQRQFDWERPTNASGGKAGTHAAGKSEGSVVPAKPANNGAAEASAEPMEESFSFRERTGNSLRSVCPQREFSKRSERKAAQRNAEQLDADRPQNRVKRASLGLLGVHRVAL